jgi:hypothetical protein
VSVEYVGPFPGHTDLVIDGWSVPFVNAREMDGGIICFTLDRRMAYDFPVGVADEAALMLADAIAVALGYASHFRAELMDDNEFRERLKRTGVHPSLLPHKVSEITAAGEQS